MKKICLSIVMQIITTFTYAQSLEADKILGVWFSDKKDSKIEIFMSENKYLGKFIWGNEMFEKDGKTSRKDTENPNPKMRNKDRLGLVFLTNLKYEDGEYTGGTVYDPRKGRSANAKVKLKGNDKLELRAFIGVSIFGQTYTFTRIK